MLVILVTVLYFGPNSLVALLSKDRQLVSPIVLILYTTQLQNGIEYNTIQDNSRIEWNAVVACKV